MRDSLVEWFGRLRSLLFKSSRESDLNREFAAHLDLATSENIRRGLPSNEARRLALLQFGGVEAAKEVHREARGLPRFESFLQDLRYACRVLKRDAGFTLFAVLIVGLGIAGATIVFSVFNTLLIRPLPFKDAKRLAWIANSGVDGAIRCDGPGQSVSGPKEWNAFVQSSGRLLRILWLHSKQTSRPGRAGVFDGCARYREFLSNSGRKTSTRTALQFGRVQAERS